MTTTDRLPDVWASRDYPVLREAARMIDQGSPVPGVDELASVTGLEPTQVKLAVSALERRGLVEAAHVWGGPSVLVPLPARHTSSLVCTPTVTTWCPSSCPHSDRPSSKAQTHPRNRDFGSWQMPLAMSRAMSWQAF